MSIYTDKKISKVLYNGTDIPLAGGDAYAYICATYIEGHTCTCSGNGKVLTAPTTTGYWVFGVDGPGTYTLTDVEIDISRSVNINNQYQIENIPVMSQFVWDCKNQAVGSTTIVDGYEWILVNKTTTAATLGLKYWYTDTYFGNSGTYKDSTIANLAATFEYNLSTKTKQWLNDVTVKDVTAKVWIPTYDQAGGSDTKRLSYYNTNNNRKFTNSEGTGKVWWTSTSYSSSNMWCVKSDGALSYSGYSASTSNLGFRPHMEVNIDF